MAKKAKTKQASSNGTTDADVQRSTDLIIAPEKKTPRLDTSKWPLLLKVSRVEPPSSIHATKKACNCWQNILANSQQLMRLPNFAPVRHAPTSGGLARQT